MSQLYTTSRGSLGSARYGIETLARAERKACGAETYDVGRSIAAEMRPVNAILFISTTFRVVMKKGHILSSIMLCVKGIMKSRLVVHSLQMCTLNA